MRSIVTRLGGLAALAVALMSVPASSHAQCITGGLTAEFQTQGQHAGLWKYCFAFDYATEGPLDEITLDFWYMKVCAQGVGCGDHWVFDEVAGHAYGGVNGCELELTGSIDCKGDDLLGTPGPLLRFTARPVGECEADYVGKGVLCFYTQFGPMQGESNPGGEPSPDNMSVYTRAGQNVCVGFFNGPRPNACATPTKPHSWGGLKSHYR